MGYPAEFGSLSSVPGEWESHGILSKPLNVPGRRAWSSPVGGSTRLWELEKPQPQVQGEGGVLELNSRVWGSFPRICEGVGEGESSSYRVLPNYRSILPCATTHMKQKSLRCIIVGSLTLMIVRSVESWVSNLWIKWFSSALLTVQLSSTLYSTPL